MKFAVTTADHRVTIVSPPGDLFDTDAIDLSYELQDLCGKGCRKAVVDLSKVGYICHSGFDRLVNAHGLFTSKHGELVLCGLTENIDRLFKTFNLETLFTFFKTSSVCSIVEFAGSIA